MWPLWALALVTFGANAFWSWQDWSAQSPGCCLDWSWGGIVAAAEVSSPPPAVPALETTNALQYFTGIPKESYYSDIILLTTVDGRLSALNSTDGRLLWSRSSFGGPIVRNMPTHSDSAQEEGGSGESRNRVPSPPLQGSRNITSEVPREEDSRGQRSDNKTGSHSSPPPPPPPSDDIHLVAPFGDGKIYKLQANNVLIDSSLTIKNMVARSPSRHNGLLYLGSKRTRYYAVNLISGQIANIFTIDDDGDRLATGSPEVNASSGSSAAHDERNTIYLARTEYRLRIFDIQNNRLKWNVIYSEYEPDAPYTMPFDSTRVDLRPFQVLTSHKGAVVARDRRSQRVLWSHQLASPVNRIFDLWTLDRQSPWVVLPHAPQRSEIDSVPPGVGKSRTPGAGGSTPSLSTAAYVGITEGGAYVYPDTFSAVDRIELSDGPKSHHRIEAPKSTSHSSSVGSSTGSSNESGHTHGTESEELCGTSTFPCPDMLRNGTFNNPANGPYQNDTDGFPHSSRYRRG
ncbi:hypothetical protein BJ085DRAFT_30703 [Dimargaris cristalligena]|uniref:Pyrrolo-quinoline quinone repeat domain-containing protein n=1 Tax=Dimargaris cristalligena TaxID=215637 RepID=A0A4P9ZK20_9FUNG|nr:hypothetical protein BJ085DRAFT_30703 [Dimargaris cristalligena]|eukprot:RKP33594.1 hypothetical protein BJ085DRAFT_30703 [Dimargaris cristalligena]